MSVPPPKDQGTKTNTEGPLGQDTMTRHSTRTQDCASDEKINQMTKRLRIKGHNLGEE